MTPCYNEDTARFICNSNKWKRVELAIAGRRTCSKVKWKFNRDMISSEFFQAVREKSIATSIMALKDPQGTLLSDPVGLSGLCSDFYSRLYSAAPNGPAQAAAMHEFIDLVSNKFSVDAKIALALPLEELELYKAAKALATNKC
jgi:hypothetical protein